MSWELILILILVVLNLVVAGVYGVDKSRAVNDEWRISERTLLILALFAPFGAAYGMKHFHHKTRKAKFKLVYVFLVIHVIIIVYALGRVGGYL